MAGHARLVDGDTIEIAGQSVRLHGIDAPESSQHCLDVDGNLFSCGGLAADTLGRMIAGRKVVCTGDERDRYGRLIAVCRVGGVDLNARMVRLGLAVAYVKYSDDYLPHEVEAAEAHRGLWAGTFQPPAEYRAARRQARSVAPPATAPEGCRIKGNISGNGRIYHMPGSLWYGRTRIS
ncbi:MAG: thermonuclease family protein, partial [Sinobacteraceae bacterium]|nr:thermonuclease family protein [Nevskiaceae bacterium]